MSPGSLYLESVLLRLSVIRLRLLEEVRRKNYQKLSGPGRDCQVPLSSRGMWQMAVQALSLKKKKIIYFFCYIVRLVGS